MHTIDSITTMSLTSNSYSNYTASRCKHTELYESLHKENLNIDVFQSSFDLEDEVSDEDNLIIKYPPFWFGEESNEHAEVIIRYYSKFLNLDKLNKGSIRKPPYFVGRILRNHVIADNIFTTLDEILIYLNESVPFGSHFPFVERKYILTTWDDDGIPLTQKNIQDEMILNFWKQKKSKYYSYVYSIPTICDKNSYFYFADTSEFNIVNVNFHTKFKYENLAVYSTFGYNINSSKNVNKCIDDYFF